MGDQTLTQNPNSPNQISERTEPLRSRWTPKPEQILILESIFNSGMVNPPKYETVRIRKLLEKYGAVGDANVFYWFQNRRSRSRRRQRQLQTVTLSGGGSCMKSHHPPHVLSTSTSNSVISSTGVGDLLIYSGNNNTNDNNNQIGFQEIEQSSSMGSNGVSSTTASNLHIQSVAGMITVFINGVATEIANGPLDIRAMFGEDLLLFHSSGLPVPFNDFGFSLQTLHHGESYFLVSRPT